MKKLVLASVMALASMSLVPAPTLRAQDSGGTITIKAPAAYAAYPVFASTIAADDVYPKKDFKAAIDEYHKELSLYPADKTTSGTALGDTLNLAFAYTKEAPPDAANAVWFFAAAWNFAPANYKHIIEKQLDNCYNKTKGAPHALDPI